MLILSRNSVLLKMFQFLYLFCIFSELFLNIRVIQAESFGGGEKNLTSNGTMKVPNVCSHTPEEKYYMSWEKLRRTCCAGHLLRPFNFDISPTTLRKCYGDEVNKVDTDLADSIWNVYWCTVKNTMNIDEANPLTLDSFAEKVTTFYPPHIKAQILENIAKSGYIPNESASPVEKLKSIRGIFYNIEELTCRGTANDVKEKPKQKNCNAKLESLKGQGACCSKMTIPFNLMSLHGGKMDTTVIEKIKNCTENLYNSIGTRKPKVKMGPVCVDTCYLLEANLVDESSLFSTPDIAALIHKLMPTFVPEKVYNEIIDTAVKNIDNTTSTNKNTWFPLKNMLTNNIEFIFKANQRGFKEIGDMAKAKALFTSCSVHSSLNRYLYVAIHKMCKPVATARAANRQNAKATKS